MSLNASEGKALKEIPKQIEKQNQLIEEQNLLIKQLIEQLKWLR